MHFTLLYLLLLAVPACQQPEEPDAAALARMFEQPPMEYRPYVWWHWMGPNFSKEGIRKDLEAMKEAGIGGATVFNIASAVQETHHPMENNPWPEQTYRSEAYWEALTYAAEVAQELGLKIGLHNSPGYSTTGGPWIDEEKGMQTVVHSCTELHGDQKVEVTLPKPELPVYRGWGNSGRQATYYQDIAVMAVPIKADVRPEEVLDLSARMDAEGRLAWEAPAGQWKVYRIGHAPTLSNPHPLPDDLIGKALEADKLNAQVSAYHWDQVLEPLQEHLGRYFGKSFTHILIDSYEAGDQNWTPGFREYFWQVCGYDPLPRIALVEADPENPRNAAFQEDWKVLIERRFLQDGWQVARDKVHEKGLLLFWEPYWGPFSVTESVYVPDVPMGEFWTGGSGRINAAIVDKAKEYGKNIVGAEAFTGRPEVSHFTEDPAFLKPSADGAFVSGVNRLFLHHWVHQPFDDRYQPGMGMGWWGTHFSRHQTWFQPGKAFFTYLSRCQMLLQQGKPGERGENRIQRITPWGQLYFVINPDDRPSTQSFPKGEQPAELWDPYWGTIMLADESDSVRVSLEPGQSLFLVQPAGHARYARQALQSGVAVQSQVLDLSWEVTFQPKLDEAFTLKDFPLQDWSRSEDPRLKFFAGTATYKGRFTYEPAGGRPVLDLGEMNDIAELSVNGKKVGTLWYPPFRADITDYVRPGDNTLEIAVTNNWANRLIGDEQFEADFEWGEDRGEAMGRAMKAFPEWFLKGEPRPVTERKAFVIWSYFRKDSPLQPAGLVGPVTLQQCGPEALPDPLLKTDGKKVKSAEDWMEVRRPQILELFAREMYGHVPERPEGLHFQTLSEEIVYDGLGIRKTVRIILDAGETHSFDVLLHLPARAPKPVPVFAGLNFNGNDATLDEREGRRWPYEDILRAGFGVATAWRDSIEPDRVDGKGGVRSWYNPGGDWGAISAWAWGLSRILDYLETDPAADAGRVAVIGHSRLGKTALWAGANDPRFAAVISNDSGCCGAAVSRRRVGETFAAIDRAFPHWFTREFDKYQGAEDRFPADQHWLCALAAPRPLYVASATEDTWADPEGEWLSARAVAPVYALFGKTGVGPVSPPADTPDNKGTVAYHVRTGKHDITRWDWLQYMDWFAASACRQEQPVRSMLDRWAQKEVLEAKPLEEGKWLGREGIATIGSVPDARWGKVLRYHSSLLDSAHIQAPENRTPWGSFLAEQGGENNVALEFDGPQDWRSFNRIAVWVYIHPSRNPNVNLAFDLVNEGTKDTRLTPGRETYLDLPQGSWQQVLWEFDYYPRDRITRFELHQTLIGYDREIGEPEVTIDVGPIELQRVVPDHYEGWDLPEGQIAFSHAGYRPADAKQALAAAGGSRFSLENEKGKTVFKGLVKPFSNKGNDFALLDFSVFHQPGIYRIRYGESLSEPFPIGDDVWREPLMSTLNFYFCQRCGYPVPGIHSACHLDTRGFSGDLTHPVTGGWHDAGDLSQGWFRTADACYALMTAYDSADKSLKARIKDEIFWGLKWLREARFPEGRHVSWNHQRIYSDNLTGTMDDVVSRAGFSAWENYLGIAVFLRAAQLFPDRKAELEAMALEDWKATASHPVGDPLSLAWGVTASALLYEYFGDNPYKETALEYARRLLSDQQEGYWPALQGSHTAFNEAPMIALRTLCRLFPEVPEKADWLQSAALYCDYLKQGSSLSAPYNLLPAGGDRTFPIWKDHIFHGATNIQLSAAWALAEAATLLNDADAMHLVQQQLEWTLGRNPFGSSLMYGVGYNYAPLFAYCSHNVAGALPVGVDSFHDDEPFWNGSACSTSHEMWVEPVSRFVGTLALYSSFITNN